MSAALTPEQQQDAVRNGYPPDVVLGTLSGPWPWGETLRDVRDERPGDRCHCWWCGYVRDAQYDAMVLAPNRYTANLVFDAQTKDESWGRK